MKLVIFTIGLVFLTVAQAHEPDNNLINEINAVENVIKDTLVVATNIINEAKPTREQVLVLVERNGLVVEAKELLKQNPRKGCRVLLREKIELVVDIIITEATVTLPAALVKVEKELRVIKAVLENLKAKLEAGSRKVHRIAEEVNGLARTVNKLKNIVPTLASPALGEIESSIIPKLAGVNVLEPVAVCLKHHRRY